MKVAAHPEEPLKPVNTICWKVREADGARIAEDIRYLRHIPGKPLLEAGPKKCARIACTKGNAIEWCNDVSLSLRPVPIVLSGICPVFNSTGVINNLFLPQTDHELTLNNYKALARAAESITKECLYVDPSNRSRKTAGQAFYEHNEDHWVSVCPPFPIFFRNSLTRRNLDRTLLFDTTTPAATVTLIKI